MDELAAFLSSVPPAPPLSAPSATTAPLLRAVEAKDVDGVRAALDAGADIEASHEVRRARGARRCWRTRSRSACQPRRWVCVQRRARRPR